MCNRSKVMNSRMSVINMNSKESASYSKTRARLLNLGIKKVDLKVEDKPLFDHITENHSYDSIWRALAGPPH